MKNWSEFGRASYSERAFPSELFLGRGMLSGGEIRALFTCAADYFAGEGHIIDAGAFAGMSAHSFACGLRFNVRSNWALTPVIHSYDKFIADDKYVADYLRNVFYSARSTTGDVKEVLKEPDHNEDFLHIFWHQNQRFSDLIEAHQGDFGQQPWQGAPIEILFIDVAKTKALQDHMFRTFLPAMLPGASLLIQQDYNHVWHPYIHLAMEVLAPCFETLVADEGASRFYLCRELPSTSLMEEALTLDFDAKQINEAYAGIVNRSRPRFRRMLQVAHVKALSDAGFADEAERVANELICSFSEGAAPAWLVLDLKRIVPR